MAKTQQVVVSEVFAEAIKPLIDVRDERVWKATMDHMFDDIKQDEAAERYGVKQYSISRMVDRIVKTTEVVRSAQEVDSNEQ